MERQRDVLDRPRVDFSEDSVGVDVARSRGLRAVEACREAMRRGGSVKRIGIKLTFFFFVND